MRENSKKLVEAKIDPMKEFDKLNELDAEDYKIVNDGGLINITMHELAMFVLNCDVVKVTFIKTVPFVKYEEYVAYRSTVMHK